MTDSETEPESDIAIEDMLLFSKSASQQEPASGNEPPNSMVSVQDVKLAVELLESLDLRSVQKPFAAALRIIDSPFICHGQSVYLTAYFDIYYKDVSLHSVIQDASSTISNFLVSICQSRFDGHFEKRDTMDALAKLFHHSFLRLAFGYRRVFRNIAGQNIAPGTVVPVIICWVDVLMVRIGQATISLPSVCKGDFAKSPPGPLSCQREEVLFRAAAQLPEKWDLVPRIMSSEQASPAAKRLALCLTFAAYVVHPQIVDSPIDHDSWDHDSIKPDEMVDIVSEYLQHVFVNILETSQIYDSPKDILLQQRITCAMIISIYATANTSSEALKNDSLSPFQPYAIRSLACLLEFVMHPDQPSSSSHSLSPCETMDIAQTILVRWGNIFPWCWLAWADRRSVGADIVIYLTVTWLYHLSFQNEGEEDLTPESKLWDMAFGPLLRKHPDAASNIFFTLIQLYSTFIASLSSSCLKQLSLCEMDVFLKITWVITHLINHADSITSSLFCPHLLYVFPILCNMDGYEAVGYIIEGLVSIGPEVVQQFATKVQEDNSLGFINNLEEAVSRSKRKLQRCAEDQDLILCRQILNFLCLLWHSNVVDFCQTKTILSFLAAVAVRLSHIPDSCYHESYAFPALRDGFLNAVAACSTIKLELDQSNTLKAWSSEMLWQFAIVNGSTDLPTAASLAHLIISSKRLCGSFACAEAWSYMQDVLLLTISHHFLGDDEPLALVVCPSICQAMSYLLTRVDRKTARFISSSPWTSSLRIALQELLQGDESYTTEYSKILKERILIIGKNLITLIDRNFDDTDAVLPATSKVTSRLIFCRSADVPRVIFCFSS
ncbi:hypothetical protein SERLA73DRAFT_71840 [Serpula lacrymans var. lacrymans S7.3]|uniref:Uncharacterized protein n=1 Tax=Serpula lacrymans var. lacrymans (strain S7.3) TaxID=936435 RepID=F8PT41_SERL3|nr:hypothetical protein SERLA73DRAFT_71840 [Serpula lacrymans var. lacrymans S7.3]